MSVGDLSIQYGWLVSEAGEHTCAGGTAESNGAHEPGCGFVPEVDLTTLDGWPQADSHTVAIAEAAREYVRCLATGRPYPYSKWNALIAAVEAEREAQSAATPEDPK